MQNELCIQKFLHTGELELSELGVKLTKACAAQEVLGAIPSSCISGVVRNGPYHNFRISTNLLGSKVAIRPMFESGRLEGISLQLLLGSQDAWAETRQELKEDATKCEKWVLERVGIPLPAKFDWGQIELVVDTISWGTPIVINYY